MDKRNILFTDLLFAERSGRELRLDLFLPERGDAPLVVVIHGGGWQDGNRKDEGFEWLVGEGFALARIEYRLSNEAVFPAQLHDCIAALRWLENHRGQFGYSAEVPLVIGTSAGGTLALLLGARRLVRGAVAYCAPCDFPLRAASQPHLTDRPGGTVHDLLGGPVAQRLKLAREASPSLQVTSDAAPSLLINGTDDPQVLREQPASFLQAALAAGADVSFVSVPGAGHCGPDYHEPWVRSHVLAFIRRFQTSP